MPRSKLQKLRATVLVLVSSATLGACATLTNIFDPTDNTVDVNAVACGAFRPITWSRGDTDTTLRQVHEHNAAWEALCAADRATTSQ